MDIGAFCYELADDTGLAKRHSALEELRQSAYSLRNARFWQAIVSQ